MTTPFTQDLNILNLIGEFCGSRTVLKMFYDDRTFLTSLKFNLTEKGNLGRYIYVHYRTGRHEWRRALRTEHWVPVKHDSNRLIDRIDEVYGVETECNNTARYGNRHIFRATESEVTELANAIRRIMVRFETPLDYTLNWFMPDATNYFAGAHQVFHKKQH